MTLKKTDPGLQLADAQSIANAINNLNQFSRSSGLTATGSSQSERTSVECGGQPDHHYTFRVGRHPPVIDRPARHDSLFCIVYNGGANALQVYGSGTDTVNCAAAATGISPGRRRRVLFTAYKGGAWACHRWPQWADDHHHYRHLDHPEWRYAYRPRHQRHSGAH